MAKSGVLATSCYNGGVRLLLAFCILFQLTWAQADPCPDSKSVVLDQGAALYKIHLAAVKSLPELSASEESYAQASCRRKKLPTTQFYEAHFAALAAERPLTDAVVNGISFSAESPKLIELFKTLTTHSGYCPPSAGVKSCQQELSIDLSKCAKVRCALDALYGKAEAPRMIYLLDKFGLNSAKEAFSPGFVGESFKNWEAEELDDAVMSLSDMPPAMKAGYSNKQYNRRKIMRAELDGGGATLADSRMTFNDFWGWQAPELRRTTTLHEFAHNFAHRFGIDKSELWLNFSGWAEETIDGKKQFVSRKPEALVSQYAASSPDEDFAESVTAYRYNPTALRAASPQKYAFIKEVVFDGHEYRRGSACKDFAPLTPDWDQKIKAKIEAWKVQ